MITPQGDACARRGAAETIVAVANTLLGFLARRWLLGVNLFVVLFLGGAFAAPALAALGASDLAGDVYRVYHATCHQWAFRSFFLFGHQPVLSAAEVGALGGDPFTFVGGQNVGWKMAFCERDLAIYTGLLGFGMLYARRGRQLGRASLGLMPYLLLAAPMALDGTTQLFGWRESTWELRVTTGLLFGLASAWLLYPRVNDALQVASTPPPMPRLERTRQA